LTDDPFNLPTATLFRLAHNMLSIHIFGAVVQAGFGDLRPSHGNVLDPLSSSDGLRQRELAERAGMTAQSVGELIDDLEKLGYVERRPDPTDRRAKRVHLTERGRAARDVAGAAVWSGESRLQELLGVEEYEGLRRNIRTILQAGTERKELPHDTEPL
jgi:DNA-binding MarR family transcriptional regulator